MSPIKQSNRLTSLIIRFPKIVVVLSLMLSALCVFYTANKLEFLTGRDDLMPRNAPFQVEYREFSKNFGDQDEIVVVIEADDPLLASRFSDALHQRLTNDSGLFKELLYPGGLPYFRQNGLLFMPLEELHGMRRTLEMAKPMLKELATSPSIKTLFSSLTGQIDDYLQRPSAEKLERLTFMLSTLDKGFAGFDGKQSALSMDSFLKGSSDTPSMLENAGRQQVIAIRPVKEQGSFVPSERAILKVRAELGELLRKPEFKGVTAGLTGVPVLEFEEMRSSMKDMEIAAALSLVLTVILLLFAFRGLRNTIAAMVTLLAGICLAFGFATLVVGHLNILSMAFAIMLVGLGVEYGIQVVLRYQEELRGNHSMTEALETGMVANVRPILLAALTTALAFLTFVLTDFKGIAELGIIAAGGICACVLATFTVLPAMLVLMNRGPGARGQEPVKAEKQNQMASKLEILFQRPGLIVGATALLALLGTVALFRVPFDFNMMNLQAKGLEPVRYAYKLMRSKENAGYFGVAMAKDRNEAASLTARLEKLPAVSHVVSLLSLVPDRQPEKLAELARMQRVMTDITPGSYEENLSPMELPAVFEAFHEQVEKLKARLEAEKSAQAQAATHFSDTLNRFFKELEKEKDGNAVVMLRDLQQAMFAPLPEKLLLLKESLKARPVAEQDVPQSLKNRFIGKDGRLLLQIVPKQEIFDKKPLAEFVGQIKSVVPNATGEPVSVYESMMILQNSYLMAFLYAFCGVVVILLLAFRSIKATLLGIAPLAAGLLIMVGGMWLFGLTFNVANIIVMPLLLGVGIDSAIYIIARYRNDGGSPVAAVRSSAGVGVFLNALTILFSFGALMVASHQGVFSIGAVMSLGMIAIVLAFLIFLPALLLLVDKQRKQG